MDEGPFFYATFLNLLINVAYTILALVAGIVSFRCIDRTFFREIDFVEEVKRGNIAAAIFASTILLFLAVIIGMAMRG